MAAKHLRKCSTSLAIREMQIKTTLRFHLTPTRMAKIRNSDAEEDVEKEEHFTAVGKVVNLYNYSGNLFGDTSENWI